MCIARICLCGYNHEQILVKYSFLFFSILSCLCAMSSGPPIGFYSSYI
jgi:hypothetical protein